MNTQSAVITIDTRHFIIHIHHPTYLALGEPPIMQLLLDPNSQMLIILCPDKETPGGQEIRVKHNKRCCDLCSKALVSKVQATFENMKDPGSYRLLGKIDIKQHLAVFSMICVKSISHVKDRSVNIDESSKAVVD